MNKQWRLELFIRNSSDIVTDQGVSRPTGLSAYNALLIRTQLSVMNFFLFRILGRICYASIADSRGAVRGVEDSQLGSIHGPSVVEF